MGHHNLIWTLFAMWHLMLSADLILLFSCTFHSCFFLCVIQVQMLFTNKTYFFTHIMSFKRLVQFVVVVSFVKNILDHWRKPTRSGHKTIAHVHVFCMVNYWCLFAVVFSTETYISLFMIFVLYCVICLQHLWGKIVLVKIAHIKYDVNLTTDNLFTCIH